MNPERSESWEDFRSKYILPYDTLRYVYWPKKGFIVWRLSTGGNAELLHIKTFVRGKGYAKELIGAMVKGLEENPPYFSIFGFALSSRAELKEIYRRLGFNITPDIEAPYKGGTSFIFHQSYEELRRIYG